IVLWILIADLIGTGKVSHNQVELFISVNTNARVSTGGSISSSNLLNVLSPAAAPAVLLFFAPKTSVSPILLYNAFDPNLPRDFFSPNVITEAKTLSAL